MGVEGAEEDVHYVEGGMQAFRQQCLELLPITLAPGAWIERNQSGAEAVHETASLSRPVAARRCNSDNCACKAVAPLAVS